ncbi:MAG: hypothetical protein ACT4O1_12460 [Gemmatimonadota bacterium]
MNTRSITTRAAVGAAAGLAGTFAIQPVRTLNRKLVPQIMPPLREDPGDYMVRKAEALLPPTTRAHVPRTVERVSSRSLALGYGATFGALYSLASGERKSIILAGVGLGVATWAVGYVGWLPLLRLMPPVMKQKPLQVASGIATHVLYGIVTAAAYRALRQRSSLKRLSG